MIMYNIGHNTLDGEDNVCCRVKRRRVSLAASQAGVKCTRISGRGRNTENRVNERKQQIMGDN